MKNLYFIVLIAFLSVGCKSVQTQTNEEKPTQTQTPVPAISLPQNVKEALENAEQFEILTWNEEKKDSAFSEMFVVNSFRVFGNELTKLDGKEKRKDLLNALYEDLSLANPQAMAACFYPHHTIKAKYKDDFIVIAICFRCGKYIGKISKKDYKQMKGTFFGGAIPSSDKSKSLPVFDKLVSEVRN